MFPLSNEKFTLLQPNLQEKIIIRISYLLLTEFSISLVELAQDDQKITRRIIYEQGKNFFSFKNVASLCKCGRWQVKVIKLALRDSLVKNTKLNKTPLCPLCPLWLFFNFFNPFNPRNPRLNIIEFSEFSVFSVAKNQSKTLIPQNKNQNFQKFFNSLLYIDLRQSAIDIRGLFSHQKCR